MLAFSTTVGRKPQRFNQYARLGPAMLAPEISTVLFMEFFDRNEKICSPCAFRAEAAIVLVAGATTRTAKIDR